MRQRISWRQACRKNFLAVAPTLPRSPDWRTSASGLFRQRAEVVRASSVAASSRRSLGFRTGATLPFGTRLCAMSFASCTSRAIGRPGLPGSWRGMVSHPDPRSSEASGSPGAPATRPGAEVLRRIWRRRRCAGRIRYRANTGTAHGQPPTIPAGGLQDPPPAATPALGPGRGGLRRCLLALRGMRSGLPDENHRRGARLSRGGFQARRMHVLRRLCACLQGRRLAARVQPSRSLGDQGADRA